MLVYYANITTEEKTIYEENKLYQSFKRFLSFISQHGSDPQKLNKERMSKCLCTKQDDLNSKQFNQRILLQ